ncbi:MAG: ComEC/Rec2 family competence protein [Candidatus Nomurabacteria bacterium]|nr:ComEC/Rec2 family competence protein [Candidatus Nomurabacteria bacterium]
MRDKIFYILCFSLIIIFGVLKVLLFPVQPPQYFENQVGEKVALAGIVIEDPDVRENNQKLTVLVNTRGRTSGPLEVRPLEFKIKVLVTVSFGEDFRYGDEVEFEGKLEKPENFTTNTGKEFDYINYLAKDGVFYLVNYADVEIISSGGGNSLKRILFAFKQKFLEKFNFAIPAHESLLMGGLILGEKATFSEELRQQFIDTGTIHIVALSGYNITIVAEWFMKLFAFLPQLFGIWIGIFAIFLFILMTGGASTAVRAGVMATLALIARATGRTYDVARALVLAATVMIVTNPMILLYDVSFQLSFIATVAVIFLSPRLEKHFTWVTKSFGLRDIVSVTFSAYIFVLPFILYKMGNLSLVALPANILVLPFIPFTMLLGFLTVFVGLFSYFVSVPFGYASYLILHYELGVISFLSRVPFASFVIPNFPLILTVLIYTYFIYKLFGRNIKKLFSKEINSEL